MKITGIIFCISDDYTRSCCQAQASNNINHMTEIRTLQTGVTDMISSFTCHLMILHHPELHNVSTYLMERSPVNRTFPKSYEWLILTFLLWQFSRTDKSFCLDFLISTIQVSLAVWFSSLCLDKTYYFFQRILSIWQYSSNIHKMFNISLGRVLRTKWKWIHLQLLQW